MHEIFNLPKKNGLLIRIFLFDSVFNILKFPNIFSNSFQISLEFNTDLSLLVHISQLEIIAFLVFQHFKNLDYNLLYISVTLRRFFDLYSQ